jgi:hypothetical protein
LFTRNDCLAADRPIAGLSGGPQPEHAAAGVIGAAVAAAMVGGLAWYRRRRDT